MSTVSSTGLNQNNNNNNNTLGELDPDLTDLQITALLSSTNPGNTDDAIATTTNAKHDKNILPTENGGSDLDMTLFNMLNNEVQLPKPMSSTSSTDTSLQILHQPVVKREITVPDSVSEPRKVVKQEFNHMDQDAIADDDEEEDEDDDNSRISLYARLDFPNFTFYVQTLQVLLGRKIDTHDDDDDDNNSNKITSSHSSANTVDVHLGLTKLISRRHGKIFYNFGTQRFELSILGRNGAFVDEVFVETGVTLPLKNNTKIQIGEIPFQFMLPSLLENGNLQLQKKLGKKKLFNPADAINMKSSLYNNSNISKRLSATSSPSSRETSTTPAPTTQAQLDADAKKKLAIKKPKQPKKAKPPKKTYSIDEIDEQYRTKPSCSYSHLIAVCLKERSTPRGMSLSEIYKGIQELYPYYYYCPDGWQSSVRHNLSLNKSFKKVSKEGKGWLWGLDEEFCAEKERLMLKKNIVQQQQQLKLPASGTVPQQSLSTLKNNGAPPPLMPQQNLTPVPSSTNKSIAQLASEIKRPTSANGAKAITTTPTQSTDDIKIVNNNIQEQLAANRAAQNTTTTAPVLAKANDRPMTSSSPIQSRPSTSSSSPVTTKPLPAAPASASTTSSNNKLSGDTMKALNYLQQELIRLTKDRKGLDKKTTTQILTQALAMTISQVNQAAKNSGMTGNPLVLLIDKNPQHLTKILTALLNAATYQVTKGKVKPGMVNNNVSSSSSSSNSGGSSSTSLARPTAAAKPATVTTPKFNNATINNRNYPQQQQQYPPRNPTKPPINDKFQPPHVTNPNPQQLSRPPANMSYKPPLSRPQMNARAVLPQQQQAKTPKPALFAKPPAYTNSGTSSPVPAVPRVESPSRSVVVGSQQQVVNKPLSYSTPTPREEKKNNAVSIDEPMNDDELDKVLESFSRQGTPDNGEPVDVDKLLAEDGFLNDDDHNQLIGIVENDRKRELEIDLNEDKFKLQKTE